MLRKKIDWHLEQFQGRRKRCKDGPHLPYDVAYDANPQLKEQLLFSISLEPAVELPDRLGRVRRSTALRKASFAEGPLKLRCAKRSNGARNRNYSDRSRV